jgi:hypothetical protein
MYSMKYYYNHCILKPLENELRTRINTNTLKTILLLLVYSYFFLSLMASFQHIKSPKDAQLV